MFEVAVNKSIPKQTLNLTQLIEMNPIEVSSNVNDLVNIVQTTIESYNATSLFVVYFIGKTMNDALLSGKYPGLTVTKLAKALGMSQTKASRYHRVAEMLTPDEVYGLRKVAYKNILRFPQIAEEYGEECFREFKFRLITNDFEGVKGGSGGFDAILADVAKHYLELDSSLPSDEEVPAAQPKLISTDVAEAEVVEVVNPCETVEDNGEDEDEGMLAVDKILADRNKESKETLSDDGSKSKSENKRKASIALAQAKRAIQKLSGPMKKLSEEAQPVLEALWQFEDYIIGDPETDESYRDMLESFSNSVLKATESQFRLLKELHKHGFALRKIEIPDGDTAESLLDPAR